MVKGRRFSSSKNTEDGLALFPLQEREETPSKKKRRRAFMGQHRKYLTFPPLPSWDLCPRPFLVVGGVARRRKWRGERISSRKTTFHVYYGAGSWRRWNRLGGGRPIFASHFYGRDSVSSFFCLFLFFQSEKVVKWPIWLLYDSGR